MLTVTTPWVTWCEYKKMWDLKICHFQERVPPLTLNQTSHYWADAHRKERQRKRKRLAYQASCLRERYRHNSHKWRWEPFVNRAWVKLLFACQSKYKAPWSASPPSLILALVASGTMAWGHRQPAKEEHFCNWLKIWTVHGHTLYATLISTQMSTDEHSALYNVTPWCSYGFNAMWSPDSPKRKTGHGKWNRLHVFFTEDFVDVFKGVFVSAS